MAYKLEIKKFDRKCKETVHLVELWWKDKTDSPIEQTMTDHGFMVFGDDRPMAAVFLYPVQGCRMAMIGFPIANPLVFKEERREALGVLVAEVEMVAKTLHYDYLLSYAGSNGAKEMFSRIGYSKGDENVTNFVKKL